MPGRRYRKALPEALLETFARVSREFYLQPPTMGKSAKFYKRATRAEKLGKNEDKQAKSEKTIMKKKTSAKLAKAKEVVQKAKAKKDMEKAL